MLPLDYPKEEPRDFGLFEQWLGMTPEQWETLGASSDEMEHDRAPSPLHGQPLP